jgi:TonB family protein
MKKMYSSLFVGAVALLMSGGCAASPRAADATAANLTAGPRRATAKALQLPPAPPTKLRGTTVIAQFDVDDTGKVRGVELTTPSGDTAYDAKLKKLALGWLFRPARNNQGVPVSDVVTIRYIL